MKVYLFIVLISLAVFSVVAGTRTLSERKLEFAVKRAKYEDLLVKTLDKIMKRGTCKTEYTFDDGVTAVVPFNPCGTDEYCYSNDDDEMKFACTAGEDAPCDDADACAEGETCTETTSNGIAGFTCSAPEERVMEKAKMSKLQRFLDELEN